LEDCDAPPKKEGFQPSWGDDMAAIDFGNFAEQCLRLAQTMETVEDKAVLLTMAQAWIQLADRPAEVRAILDMQTVPPS